MRKEWAQQESKLRLLPCESFEPIAAILYSLIETAKLNVKDPKRYLKAALAAALEGEPVLLPHAFNPD